MSEKSPPTRMLRLELNNFRCFDSLTIRFEPRLTVIVAPNGMGKTAVLDALGIAWRPFVDALQFRGHSHGFSVADVRRQRMVGETMEPCLPTSLKAEAILAPQLDPLLWGCERSKLSARAKGWSQEASLLKLRAKDIYQKIWTEEFQISGRGKGVTAPTRVSDRADSKLPLIVQYGTGRLFVAPRSRYLKVEMDSDPTSRFNGYTDYSDADSRYRMFEDWFERYSREAQKERKSTHPASRHQPHKKLRAVVQAVDTVLNPSGWHSLEWDFVEDAMVAHHPIQGTLEVSTLSDGIRGLIGLTADIAHRCVRLNPQCGENAPRETPGIVMIDEVDMHLHPVWQQLVVQLLLKAFPLMQFIVTTHSPQVISTVERSSIRVLQRDLAGRWIAEENVSNAYGHSNSRALEAVMGGTAYPEHLETVQELREYQRLVGEDRHDSPEALRLRAKLEGVWGGDDHELQLMDVSIRKNEVLRKIRLQRG